MLATKRLIRKQIKQKIDQLLSKPDGKGIIEKESNFVKEKLFSHQWFKEAKRVAIYVSTTGEIITDEIILRALEDGKEVFIPRIRQHSIDLHPPTYFDGMTTKEKDQFLDLIVMPGVAFTLNGKRLGHGRGYYDRFLLEYSQKCNGNYPKTIALVLNIQIIDDLPMSEKDVYINEILHM
uniref:5-formyltetrahydrofolate cyclo-ligase n=1 Tax=Meloidogyne hapla TaxID=6305 RepID=A0A1I8BMQ3_MELHA